MRKFLSGNEAFAEGVRLARPQVISAYPITPQTTVVEALAALYGGDSLILPLLDGAGPGLIDWEEWRIAA